MKTPAKIQTKKFTFFSRTIITTSLVGVFLSSIAITTAGASGSKIAESINQFFGLQRQQTAKSLESNDEKQAQFLTPTATFVVNSIADTDDGQCTTDSGGCTLREAINAANATVALDTITFNIGAGTPTITVTSGLPAIVAPVIIDGNTGGATRVLINGNNVNASGLFLDGNGNTIRRLVINRFNGNGITLNTSNSNVIEGNFIGTDAGGATTAGFGNSGQGINVLASQTNLIGGAVGTTPGGSCTGACNLISGNGGNGIYLDGSGAGGAASNTIQGNFIGTDVTGTIGRGNGGSGIRTFNSATNNAIGGTSPNARNLISGHTNQRGIDFGTGGKSGVVVQGNYIGVNTTATAKIPNGDGITFFASGSGVTIGGTAAGAANVISGNNTAGIRQVASNFGALSNSAIQGNFIGTDPTGTRDLGNGAGNNSGLDARGGIALSNGASGNTIGGTGAGAANVIAFNSGAGVRLGASNSGGTPASGAGNAIRGNSIYFNNGLGISLGDGGGIMNTPLTNDLGDADTGANNRQNYPVLTSVSETGGIVTVQGTLNSVASTTFNVDFYVNENQDASGNGEGQVYVGSQNVTTDASGNAAVLINYAVVPGKPFTTATATNATTNDTSEFSAAILLAANSGTFVFSSPTYSAVENAGTATITVNRANGSTGAACVSYATSDGTASGSDYTANSGQLCFADGETSKTFSVSINDDATAEQDEIVNLTLSNPTGGSALGFQSAATLTIVNDDSFVNFVVNTTADANDGACTALGTGNGCTLREAITAANGTAALDTISFNIGTGASDNTPTITVSSGLPAIVAPVIIDGNTGGATRVEINGNNVNASGLTLTGNASRSTIRRLVINRFNGNGILIGSGGNNNVIEGNFIGTDSGGTLDFGNTANGISFSASSNNTIGGAVGTTPGGSCTGACNLISGNGGAGISGDPSGGTANGNVIQGNFIGTNVSGTAALGNNRGISFLNAVNNTQIGGASANTRNLISGNGDLGVLLSAAGINGNVIRGNFIGVNTTATAKIGNGVGVVLFFTATNNSVVGNVISGNAKRGIEFGDCGTCSSPPHNNVVQGNFIGTDPTGALNLGNGQVGITVEPVGGVTLNSGAFNNRIGGTAAGEGNVVAFNYGAGIRLGANSSYPAAGAGNSLLGNSIYSNEGLGIALSDGTAIVSTPLANDTGDADGGANNRQNYPVLTAAASTYNTVNVAGTLNSLPNTAFTIQFFASATADSSGNGEGETFVGSQDITTNNSGNANINFNFTAVSGKNIVSATATNKTTGDASEFSANRTITVVDTPPIVQSVARASGNPTSQNSNVQFAVVFSEAVTGVNAGDFTLNASNLNGASITSVAGSGAAYTVTVNTGTLTAGNTSGTLRLDVVDDDSIMDGTNNPLGGAGAGNGNYNSGEVYAVNVAYPVAGKVVYGTTAAGELTKFVPGVLISAAGTNGESVTTNATGDYTLTNLIAGGQYTITPTKAGNANGITAFDATLVLRCVAAGSGCVLTDNQKLAADANGSGTITSFDATQILRYVAAGAPTQTAGQVGNWKFNPLFRQYMPLDGARSAEDYTAILIGEINGNWTPAP